MSPADKMMVMVFAMAVGTWIAWWLCGFLWGREFKRDAFIDGYNLGWEHGLRRGNPLFTGGDDTAEFERKDFPP